MSSGDDYLRKLIRSYRDSPDSNERAIKASDLNKIAKARMRRSIRLQSDDGYGLMDVETARRLKKILLPKPFSQTELDAADPYGDALLQRLFKPMMIRANRIALDLGLLKKEVTNIGTLPVGTPNAMAIAVPGTSDHVVVFQQGLPLFLNRMSKLAVSVEYAIPPETYEALPFADDNWQPQYRQCIAAALKKETHLGKRLLELLVVTIFDSNPNLATPHHVNASSSLVRAALLGSMEMFIIGHELGHVSLGHLERSAKRSAISIGVDNFEVISPEYAQEIEADAFGYVISDASAFDQTNNSESDLFEHWMLAAPDFFFSCIAILERFMSVCGVDWSTADSHPDTKVRREHRRNFLKDVDNRAALVTGERLEIALEMLADAVEHHFLNIIRTAAK